MEKYPLGEADMKYFTPSSSESRMDVLIGAKSVRYLESLKHTLRLPPHHCLEFRYLWNRNDHFAVEFHSLIMLNNCQLQFNHPYRYFLRYGIFNDRKGVVIFSTNFLFGKMDY